MIVPTLKVQIVALKDDKDALIKSLQRAGEIMLIAPKDRELDDADTLAEEQLAERTARSLALLRRFKEKTAKVPIQVTYEEFVADNPLYEQLLTRTEATAALIEQSRQELITLKEKQALYQPWEGLEMRLDQLKTPKTTVIRTGFIDHSHLETLVELYQGTGNLIQVLGKQDNHHAILLACTKDDLPDMDLQARNLGFAEATLPQEPKTPAELLRQISLKRDLLSEQISEGEATLRLLAKEEATLKLLYDRTATEYKRKRAKTTDTDATVFLEGWVRSDRIDRLTDAILSVTELYDLEIVDPDPGEQPPTVTKNNLFVDSFETITDMFEKPHPDEVDPNPVMSIWYWIIFGMMMGDVGYGVVMIVLFALMIAKMKPKGNALRLFRVLMFSGISTIIWGVLFGSYFGATWNPILMSPMDKPLEMLILSIVIGACHIISGLLVKAYRNYRDKRYFSILADQFSWIFILIGVGMLVIPALKTVGIGFVVAGAALIVLFAGRKNKNLFARFGSGLYSLYGITGYLGDILSYARILALAMSSAVIAMVMNMLAGMLQGNVFGFIMSLFVYLVGHLFNLAMGMLSAYIHDSRLQYIEFFNKFYEGGGIPFQPLMLQTNYVDSINDAHVL